MFGDGRIQTSTKVMGLLRLSRTCGLKNSKLNRQMRFRYHYSNVRRLLPTSDFCRACGNKIVEHNSVNETVHGSSRNIWWTVANMHVIERRSDIDKSRTYNVCRQLTINERGRGKYRDRQWRADQLLVNNWFERHWQITIFFDSRVQ